MSGADLLLAEPEDMRSTSLFTATRSLMALDHFRVPYVVDRPAGARAVEQLRARGNGRALLWPSAPADHGLPVAAVLASPGKQDIPIFASVVPDRAARSMLVEYGGSWEPVGSVSHLGGEQLGSIWRSDEGSVFLPFDPDEAHLNLLSERYNEILLGTRAHNWRRTAMRSYYRVRGSVPRPLQIWLRRRYALVQARRLFPRWPVESGLHDLLELFGAIAQEIAGELVPRIAAWPSGHTWALVLTHDVETAKGLSAMDAVLEAEQRLHLRSCWNLVPKRYEVSEKRVRDLTAAGFEVGVHGLYHDGRDLESASMLRERLPGMRAAAQRWNARGFRSPATHRGWELMPLLGFDYDSSYPDTDPFEPQGGGCCTWLPFLNGGMVELPMTMPQDHTLFVILRQQNEGAWVEKARFLRSRGGMALLDTHPDYLVNVNIFRAYETFLEQFSDDPGAWKALPWEVSAWWRRRAGSWLERAGSDWKVTGPAAGEATVEFFPSSKIGTTRSGPPMVPRA